MHIVICCNSFPLRSQTFVTSQVLGLARRGHRVTVVAEWVNEELLAELPGASSLAAILSLGTKGTPPLRSPVSRLLLVARAMAAGPGYLRASSHNRTYLRPLLRWRGVMAARAFALAGALPAVDLVHAHMGAVALWARAIALRHRVPLTVTFHGTDATRDPLEIGWEPYRQLLDPSSTTFIVHSPFVAERLRAGLGIDPVPVPLGIDSALFAPPRRARDARMRNARPRLSFIGRLIPMKGARIALETLALLRGGERGQPAVDATLDIVGEGPEASAIPPLSEALGIASSIRVYGPQRPADVAARLRESDVLLVPSLDDVDGRAEAYGLVCLEANGCGVPVVGTYCGGLPSAIDPPVGGLCVPQHSPFAMAEAVRRVLADVAASEQQARMRRRILESHDETHSLESYERVFEDAIQRARGSVSLPADNKPSGVVRRNPPIPPLQRIQGSLAAYVSGRRVIELRRRPPAILDGALHGMAKSWDIKDWPGGQGAGALPPEPPEVLVDLDGIALDTLRGEVLDIRRAYGPTEFMIVAVLTGPRGSIKIERAMFEPEFRAVVLLDRLFTPRPDRPEHPASAGRRETARRDSERFRYLLCIS